MNISDFGSGQTSDANKEFQGLSIMLGFLSVAPEPEAWNCSLILTYSHRMRQVIQNLGSTWNIFGLRPETGSLKLGAALLESES